MSKEEYQLYIPFLDFFARYDIYSDDTINKFKELVKENFTIEEKVTADIIIALMDQYRDVSS